MCVKWNEHSEDLKEEIALHREQAREVVMSAKAALERVLSQAQGVLVIHDIKTSIGACDTYLENIP